MLIGIQPDQIGEESYSQRWMDVLGKRKVEVRTLNLLDQGGSKQAAGCDGVMWRWFHNPAHKQSARKILFFIEHNLKIPVFPNTRTSWHFDDKIAQYYLLTSLEAPLPETHIFWDMDQAMLWVEGAKYPLVFKLSVGAGSSTVMKISSVSDARRLVHIMFRKGLFPSEMDRIFRARSPWDMKRNLSGWQRRWKDTLKYLLDLGYPPLPEGWWWKPEFGYAYFQEFIPVNDFDTRITVIGDRAFGFRRYNRPNDFRASGSGLIDFNPGEIEPSCIQIALEISNKAQFQSMAYDFLNKNGSPVITEISYTFADWAVHECPGFWDQNLVWHPEQLWPEEAQIDVFLAEILKNRLKA